MCEYHQKQKKIAEGVSCTITRSGLIHGKDGRKIPGVLGSVRGGLAYVYELTEKIKKN
ncbi:hypothetical protein K440DRAFT_294118 [Wilcoxina mikolae CBS 423.85]|nr:hypothetical protein K440DRAFT_294118 [Wilcoxina mikolae CBS 423.85]